MSENHPIARLFTVDIHRPVRERDRRTLLEESGVGHSSVRVPVEHLVYHTMTPAGCTLHLRNSHLLHGEIPDDIDQLYLYPGQLRHLLETLTVQGSKEPAVALEYG